MRPNGHARLGYLGTKEHDAAFTLGPRLRHETAVTRDEIIERIARGGFPDVLRRSQQRRDAYLTGYVADLVNRDVVQLSQIERGPQMHALVRSVAARSGQPIAPATLGSSLGIDNKTTGRYLALLEEVFLIKRIPAWTRRLSQRETGQPKVAFVDSGVAAALLGQNPARLRKPGSPLGGLLEGFVAMEIARQLTWSQTDATMSHYRTKDGVEVDIVLENRSGEVIGLEVKASSTPTPKRLQRLAPPGRPGRRRLHRRVRSPHQYPHSARWADDVRGPAGRPLENSHGDSR